MLKLVNQQMWYKYTIITYLVINKEFDNIFTKLKCVKFLDKTDKKQKLKHAAI